MPGLLAMADAAGLLEIVGQPFMQRALLGGLLTGALGGLLGSFAVLRQLSFFSDALGHSACWASAWESCWGSIPPWC